MRAKCFQCGRPGGLRGDSYRGCMYPKHARKGSAAFRGGTRPSRRYGDGKQGDSMVPLLGALRLHYL